MGVHFFKKIPYTAISKDLESLTLLQTKHMYHVPFENLDIVHKRPLTLSIDGLYDKIVINKRGGYCYELNGLFNSLLQDIGFSTTLISARVLREDGSYGPEFDHLALLVQLEEDYIVDLGFGDSVRSPLKLNGEIVTDVSGSYRVIIGENGMYQFQKMIDGMWCSEYIFSIQSRTLTDFAPMNQHKQSSPDTIFTQKTICSIATPEGRKSISGSNLITTSNGNKHTTTIKTSEEWVQILNDQFGVFLENSN